MLLTVSVQTASSYPQSRTARYLTKERANLRFPRDSTDSSGFSSRSLPARLAWLFDRAARRLRLLSHLPSCPKKSLLLQFMHSTSTPTCLPCRTEREIPLLRWFTNYIIVEVLVPLVDMKLASMAFKKVVPGSLASMLLGMSLTSVNGLPH